MNYNTFDEYKKEVYPAITLDTVLPPKFRKHMREISLVLLILIFLASLLFSNIFSTNVYLFRSVFVLLLCGHIGLQLLEAMYRSYYFKNTNMDIRVIQILDSLNLKTSGLAVISPVEKKDITKAFLKYDLGTYVMYRLGFSDQDIKDFLETKKDSVTLEEFEIIKNDDEHISFVEFGYSLIHFDSDLTQLLRTRGITIKDFKQTLEWVSRMDTTFQNNARWWLYERLLRIPSVGKNLSFGQVYYLEKFGHSILTDTSYVQLGEKWRIYNSSVNAIESALSKFVGGNILITAKETHLCMDAIAALGKKMLAGTVLPNIEGKRIYVLDASMLLSVYEDKGEFELMFKQILVQSANAGNVILVIPNLPSFVQSAYSLGTDVKDLLSEVLSSNALHVIATADEREYHEVLETDFDLMSHFEKIQLKEFDEFQAITILEDEVLYAEQKEKVFFTYQAVSRIVESADRYFSNIALSSKSVDILYEIIPIIKNQGKKIITEQDIDDLAASKTGISLGKITRDESKKLSHLKEKMYQRVIGQKDAIDAVYNAMIRTRAGLANPKKPLASFMFVGSTGVGKTETAKVLADLFFGNEEAMLRSDMSEYSDETALDRILGDYAHPGIFASKVREAGHGVLLLDEFEKASPAVHDLFLQILDEGFFTDGRGEKVVLRNFIIIATSNAGSEMLYNQDTHNPISKDSMITYIISKNILKTELLNRFDDIILFSSLQQEDLTSIAEILVKKISKKLDERGIILKETPEFIEYLAKRGSNPKFGAREMNRVILKEVESKIAQALVLGDLFEGDTISFTVRTNELEIQKHT